MGEEAEREEGGRLLRDDDLCWQAANGFLHSSCCGLRQDGGHARFVAEQRHAVVQVCEEQAA